MALAFLYAGQGSQKAGMGKDLYDQSPLFKEVIDRADELLDISLREKMFSGTDEELAQTSLTQPVLAAFAAGVTALLYQAGIRPDYVAGLSLGEYSALHAAGVFDRDTLIRLTAYRGKAMEEAGKGIDAKMYAVLGLDAPAVEEICRRAAAETGLPVEVANYNCKGQNVISGIGAAVAKAAEIAKAEGAKRCIPLKVSSAFHTSLMAPASDALHEIFPTITFGDMEIPVIFNTTADVLQADETVAGMLEKQVKNSVRMAQTITYLADHGVDTIVEIGPGKALTGFVRKTVSGVKTYNIDTWTDFVKVKEELGQAE